MIGSPARAIVATTRALPARVVAVALRKADALGPF